MSSPWSAFTAETSAFIWSTAGVESDMLAHPMPTIDHFMALRSTSEYSVWQHLGIRGHEAADEAERPDRGVGLVGAVRVVEPIAEVRHVLLSEVLARVVGRRIAHDGEDLLLGHEASGLVERGRLIELVVR